MAKSRRRDRRPRPPGTPTAGPAGREHWREDGAPKTRFPNQDEANRASLRLRLYQGADLDPYPCRLCDGWHLGSRRS